MLELLIIVLCLYIGYQAGVSVTAYRLRYLLLKELNKHDMIRETLEEKQTVHQLEVEQISDILYLYSKTNREFICQASTVEHLAELALKNKNINYAIVVHDKTVYSFVDGKILEKE